MGAHYICFQNSWEMLYIPLCTVAGLPGDGEGNAKHQKEGSDGKSCGPWCLGGGAVSTPMTGVQNKPRTLLTSRSTSPLPLPA
ncbi:hypothetical protein SKAU_G00394070 [Synaphobranchus kaupii]|uniref:Uncharacterized protein n=1 Tax=Synaphobranchus kaupii TaxID=118154 RepID=A0A9Q1EC31_SYNKA|nr:hypothetical protein SKAU_G00394070 [Synaphobranchus kaupii]